VAPRGSVEVSETLEDVRDRYIKRGQQAGTFEDHDNLHLPTEYHGPLTPHFTEAYSGLNPADKLAIKKEWLDPELEGHSIGTLLSLLPIETVTKTIPTILELRNNNIPLTNESINRAKDIFFMAVLDLPSSTLMDGVTGKVTIFLDCIDKVRDEGSKWLDKSLSELAAHDRELGATASNSSYIREQEELDKFNTSREAARSAIDEGSGRLKDAIADQNARISTDTYQTAVNAATIGDDTENIKGNGDTIRGYGTTVRANTESITNDCRDSNNLRYLVPSLGPFLVWLKSPVGILLMSSAAVCGCAYLVSKGAVAPEAMGQTTNTTGQIMGKELVVANQTTPSNDSSNEFKWSHLFKALKLYRITPGGFFSVWTTKTESQLGKEFP
jgi:hypothetical protein